MVRFSDDLVDTNSIIGAYLEQGFGDYSGFLNQAPIYIKYFSKNSFESTHDQHLEAVQSVVGVNSSVKYDSIENVPLYAISEFNFDGNNDGYGDESDITGDALLIPETVIPKEDDFFIIKYDKVEYLYRIKKVDSNRIKGKSFYRVSFYLSDAKESDIEKQVNNQLSIVTDLTNKSNINIILKNNALYLEKILRYIDRIKTNFISLFYVKHLNDFGVFNATDRMFITDKHLKIFIQEFDLMKEISPKRNEIFLPYQTTESLDSIDKDVRLNFINVIKGIYNIEEFPYMGVKLTKYHPEAWEVASSYSYNCFNLEILENSILETDELNVKIFKGLRNFVSREDNLGAGDIDPYSSLVEGKWYYPYLSFTRQEIMNNTIKRDLSRIEYERQVREFDCLEKDKAIFKLIKFYLDGDYENRLDELEMILPYILKTEQSIENFYFLPICIYILRQIYKNISKTERVNYVSER